MNFDTKRNVIFSKKSLLIALLVLIGGVFAGWIVSSGKAGSEGAKHEDHAEGKYEHEEQGKKGGHADEEKESRIKMTEAQVKQSGVEIATAGPARIGSAVKLIGEIQLNADRTVHVVPRLVGLVETVSASAGDRVRKDQVLAVISSQSLADQRSDLLAAQKRLALARTTLAREKKLWEEKISAEQDYQQAQQDVSEAEIAMQSAKQKLMSLRAGSAPGGNLTRYEIRAPIDGIVTAKDISVGEVLKDDSSIFTVADLATVWAEMTIYAKDLNVVKVGQKAIVKATAFESQSTGTISYVGSLVGKETRAATARIVLPNPDGMWRPGLAVNIDLIASEADVPIVIAPEAVQTLGDKPTVFVREGEQFEPRPVQLGRSDDKWSEVIAGLKAGEQYAAKNSFILKAEVGKGEASHDH
jgi:membrane fusion protein, heavy metal efflux system